MTFRADPACLTPEMRLPIPLQGSISLVGAGPGSRDLLTFRAADRLARADAVFYDRLVDPEVLALARPGAACIFVGKHVGANAWPQHRINAVIVAAALQGQHVVRLKSGDPSIFGRACEEIEAARAAGIPVDIVPGITAASAAAAALCQPLTTRGQTDRILIATGTCRPGDPAPDIAASIRPGTTLALYMAVHRITEIQSELLASGLAADTCVSIVSSAGTAREYCLQTNLGDLCLDVQRVGLRNPAVIFVRCPKAPNRDVNASVDAPCLAHARPTVCADP